MTTEINVVSPNGFRYGTARYRECATRGKGWEFIPNIPVRMRSRKLHATADACIPAWCRSESRVEVTR